ncbi:Transcription factor iws1 [Mucor velutinosus]|uniref:Serine/threonine protein kinase, CMGC, dual-specificity n=1 Tax=Mucor velutinosus TaxID=708070 RepID=A0AAN7D664_9FUNG|nr:serine/threonine protein kinase, CMGC, dual-specificity [Mucor velutinosus]KAK4516493.1 Transcription factor iws1 [Mucor velutinosus]
MSNIVIDQSAILALVESVKALHSRLDVFEKAQQAQQALNDQFRQDVNNLHSVISNLEKLVRSPTTAPANPPNTVNSDASTTPAPQPQPHPSGTQPPQWTQVLQRPASANPKRRREHAIRVLQPPRTPTDTPAYDVIHLHRAHRMSHAEYRATLAAVGIDSKRILDVTFPARNIATILIHTDYRDDILRRLTEGGLTAIPDFNPLDAQHVADPKFADMPAPQLVRIAAALHADRCVRTVRFVKLHTVPGVLKFFISQNWISTAKAQALSAELLPRPPKRTPNIHSNLGQLLLEPSIASQLRKPVLYDLFGNVVESDFMEVTEEFHPSAHSTDPEESHQ